MVKLVTVCAAGLLLAASPAFADEPLAVTPSGVTESYFGMSVGETSDLLANKCLDLGWTMVTSTQTTVVCEVPVSFGNRLLSALAGPRYATPPRQYFRFNLAGSRGYTRVQASSWQEIETAFGQTQRTDLQSENYHNNVMGFFQVIGGHYPPNTQFPNHAAMEVDYEYVKGPREGMLLSGVRADGPFGRAGLRAGDIVTKIAGERIKDNNDVSDGLHKAIRGATFDVEYFRAGQRMEASVPRVFRATTGPLPELSSPTPAASNQPPTTTIVQNEFSVADELGRFAALREQGVLTDDEFEAQKARLLSRTEPAAPGMQAAAVEAKPVVRAPAVICVTCRN
jgi:membrane-associated protease RseP (regulator of RpoE activity)